MKCHAEFSSVCPRGVHTRSFHFHGHQTLAGEFKFSYLFSITFLLKNNKSITNLLIRTINKNFWYHFSIDFPCFILHWLLCHFKWLGWNVIFSSFHHSSARIFSPNPISHRDSQKSCILNYMVEIFMSKVFLKFSVLASEIRIYRF